MRNCFELSRCSKISSISESNNFSKSDQFVVAIGNSKTRLDLTCRLLSFGYSVPVIVHPMATVSPSAFLGPGTVVFSQAVIQSSATTGKATILNTSCSVDHDTHLCDGVHICPGAHLAGHVTVGSCSWLGIGSSVIQNIHIGRNVVIGAGSTVLTDIPDDVTAVGTPPVFMTDLLSSWPSFDVEQIKALVMCLKVATSTIGLVQRVRPLKRSLLIGSFIQPL